MKPFVCANCRKDYETAYKFCPRCGEKVEEVAKTDIKFVCANCKKEHVEVYDYCPDCGGQVLVVRHYTIFGKTFECGSFGRSVLRLRRRMLYK